MSKKRSRMTAWPRTLAMIVLLTGTLESMGAINGVLSKNPANPRYFTDDTGKAVYLTGTHTWPNLVDGWLIGHNDPAPEFDWTGYLNYLESHNQNFIRLWCQELPKTDFTVPCGGTPNPVPRIYYPAPSPWLRPGPGVAQDGKLKFDLNQLNPAYFSRLLQRVADANSKGIYVSIMLFEGFGTRVKTGNLGWVYSPFNAGNNTNGINGDPNGDGCGIEAHSLRIPAITAIQKAYVKRVIDTVNDFDNVLYEIANEEWNNSSSGYSSIAWQTEIMTYIRTYESGKPKQHPVLISCIYNDAQNGGENGLLTGSTADGIAPYGAGTLNDNPPATTGGANDKVVFADTDHIWGIGGGCDWVWKVFTRGYNTLYMDGWFNNGWVGTAWYDADTYNRETANAALGATLAYARKMNLAAMTPQNTLASTAYCLANTGSEYLVYQPVAGNVTVYSLPAGTYTYEWTHPDTGAFDRSGILTTAGGNQSFTPPFAPAVLYLKKVAANQVSPPTLSPAGGSFYDSISVLLGCGTSGAAIRYTTDGSEPDNGSTLYTGAVTVSSSVTLKAKGFKEGLLDSNTMGANFVKLSSSGTIIDDQFNDGSLGANSTGIGSGWNAGSFNGAPMPAESGGSFNASMGTENGIGAIHGKDIFTFWDADGMTATWVIRDMTVQTPHAYNSYLAYCWELGLISARNSNSGSAWNMSQMNTKGGFYISVGKKDNSDAVEMWVVVSSKAFSGVEGSSGFIRLPAQQGNILGRRWTATFPLTVTATLTSNGWSVGATGLATPLSGNWTTSLISGTTNASISDEFVSGAFLFTAGRNHGIDGTGHSFTPNSGSMERVLATRNAGSTVGAPVFSPDGATFATATDVTLSSPTAGSTIRYTLDGSAPATNSGLLYAGPVRIAASCTMKAIAFKSGMTASAVSSRSYVILDSPATDSLVNGSFENGSNGWMIYSTDLNVPACEVVTNQGRTDGPHALALGNVNAKGNAALLQIVKTVTGSNYVFQFDYGAYGASGKTQQLLVELLANGLVFTSRVVTANGPGNYLPQNTTFSTHTLPFTASTTSTVFRFTDLTTLANSEGCDGMLDNVSLTGAAVAPPPIRLACIGDSITAGAYPGLLQTLLGSPYQVENDGVSSCTMLKKGDYPYWTYGKLSSLFSFQPDIVTIKLGTNDTKPQNWAPHASEFKADYLAMIDVLNALPSRPRIFLVLPVPAWTNNMGIDSNSLEQIVTLIGAVAAECNLPTIDAHTPFHNSASLFPDGVHPNAQGSAEIADLFYQAIVSDRAAPAVAWPTFSPAAGSYATTQSVTIATTNAGATIRYTLDGSTPSASNGLVYGGPVSLSSSTMLKAIALKSGMPPSAITRGSYTIQPVSNSSPFVNGSFESGTNGWTVTSADANPPKYGVNGSEGRTDGTNALILGNANSFSGNTVFAQTVTTIPGAGYQVRFQYGAFGNGNTVQALRSEALDGVRALSTLDVTAVESAAAGNFNPAKVVFRTYTNSFLAASSATVIRFSDRTTLTGGNNCDGVLDNVSLTGPFFKRGGLILVIK